MSWFSPSANFSSMLIDPLTYICICKLIVMLKRCPIAKITVSHLQSWDAMQPVHFQHMVVDPVHFSIFLDSWHCPHSLLISQTGLGRLFRSKHRATSQFTNVRSRRIEISLQFVVKSWEPNPSIFLPSPMCQWSQNCHMMFPRCYKCYFHPIVH